MTKKCLLQTPNPPRIPIFYTLTKIHKPKPVGRPIISGCDGPTERIASFVDTLLQPIAQKQQFFIKDTTDFISFIEKTKIGFFSSHAVHDCNVVPVVQSSWFACGYLKSYPSGQQCLKTADNDSPEVKMHNLHLLRMRLTKLEPSFSCGRLMTLQAPQAQCEHGRQKI